MKINLLDLLKKSLTHKERELFTKFEEHIQLSLLAIDILIDIIPTCNYNDIYQKYLKIEEYEKKGDKLASILNELTFTGAIVLGLQSYLTSLIDIVDDILDIIHFLSGEVIRKCYLIELRSDEAAKLEYEICKYMRHSKLAIKKLHDLMELVKSGDWSTIQKIVSEIENIEEEGDSIKHLLLDELYANWKNIREPYFSVIKNFIYEIDKIEDKCEDASNLILLITSYYST